jgi:hypothetical protein
MSDSFGPVYEVSYSIDPDIAGDFDAWLGPHIEEMLLVPGIIRANTYTVDGTHEHRPRRVTHYLFASNTDLDNYLVGPAAIMRRSSEELFAGHFSVSRQILHETALTGESQQPTETCLNCGATLSGQYCGECGQRAKSRLISIWELLQDAFGDILEVDSRLWRTLIPLATRPGQLTRDYLEGRRARFMPPFRTYLVLSIIFFLVAFFDPREELGILFEPPVETVGETDDAQGAAVIRDEILGELAGEIVSAENQPAQESAAQSQSQEPSHTAENDGYNLNIRIDNDGTAGTSDCTAADAGDLPPWMASRLTPERLQSVCERVSADDGDAFLSKLLDNVPTALFVLLPLMALILKVLYPLSKRYYVEHLLFVVHFHAFVFLILTLQILFVRMMSLAALPEAISAISVFLVSLYIPVYLYKSMRRVYGQGHWLVSLKFMVLLLSYFGGLTLIFLFVALFAAFSI